MSLHRLTLTYEDRDAFQQLVGPADQHLRLFEELIGVTAERLSAALDAHDASGATPFKVLQNQYNIVARGDYVPDLQPLCVDRGIAMLHYF